MTGGPPPGPPRAVHGGRGGSVALLEGHEANLGLPPARLIDRTLRVWELRPGDHRVADAEHGAHIVLLHAGRKRSRQLDMRELR